MARNSKQHDSDMTKGVIWKQLLQFALPMCVGLIFQQLYNTVDTIVVGRFVGKEALAAVGTTGHIINMLVSLSAGLSSGATVLVSQHYGAHNKKRLSDAVQTTVVLTFIATVFISIVGLLLVKPMLRFMATPEDVFDLSKQYITIYFAGIIGLLFYNMGSGILRAVGDSTRPLYFLIFSAVLNTILDLIFVAVFKLGVAGVAYATIGAQIVSAILVMRTLTVTDGDYKVRWKELRFVPAEFRSILKIGLPTSIQQAITSFSNTFVQSYINILGSTFMAGWSTYGKLDGYVLLPMQALALASSTFVGQNYGAKKFKRARKGVNVSLGMSEITTVFLGIVVWIFAPQLMMIFTKDAEVIEISTKLIRIITPFYVCNCVNQMYAGALRGIGSATIPTIVMLSSFVGFRQLYLFIMKTLFGGTEAYVTGVCFAFPAGWIMCTLLMMIFYRRSVLFKAAEAEETE